MPRMDDGVPRRNQMPLVVAGALAVGLIAPAAAPAAAADDSTPEAPRTRVVEDIAVGRFVQEGTPAPVGGRLVQLDPFYVQGPSYSMTKGGMYPFSGEMNVEEGVLDTAFVASAGYAAVYRGDGSIEQFDASGNWMPDVPTGSGVLGMASGSDFGSAFVVTGDGELVTSYWEWQQILPEDPLDLGYVAVAAGDDVFYAVRSSGEIVGFAKPENESGLACQDYWTPAEQTSYTAISAAGRAWMALRSDGAVVTCGYGTEPLVGEVHVAAAGSTFVGVDAGRTYGLAASSTGEVASFGATDMVATQPPAGSRVIGLSAGADTGASILDDGSLITWGEPLSLPEFPAGTERFVAVSENSSGETYAIWAHEVLDLQIDVTVPESVRIGQRVNAQVEVTYDGTYRPDGQLCLVDRSESTDALCAFQLTDGAGTIPIETDISIASTVQHPGTREFGIGFINPLGRFTYTTVTFEVLPPAATELRATVPSSYAAGADVSATFELDVEDETVPAGEVVLWAVVGEDDEELGYTDDDVLLGQARMDSTDPVRVEIDSDALPDGQYPIKAKYLPELGQGEYTPTAPARWRGTLTVGTVEGVFSAPRSPALSGTAQVGKTLTAVRGTWTPSPTKTTYQWRVDGKAVSGATGSTWKVPSSARGKKVSVAVTGTKTGYTTKTLVSPSSSAVKAGVFSAPAPRITGTPKVGAKLSVVRGAWTPQPTTAKYQWKVGSTTIKGATRSFFTVPSSARGKRVTVVVTGSAAGYTTKVVSRTTTNTMK
ncbi:hypothetical protein [Promicromonospora sp. NPDC057488]|uniref:hypothetical protein n=1 Tax=Promicromonospora sp. NPDC057488 TaxID=3346147 RepID=UPI00366EFB64